ncbi:DnaJ domain-containing protein [Methylobacterium sp. NEAU K]|uniref:J domain-containing protein n=1 Tax=Methylobacterium sp. NEAU K TaxID=3064946 RepID=UPI0027370A5C|nr:DnaJ domain-containing protein [Methylobacterium sp. NEAU K]MDP4004942.1 DnaJ domain-containing protein [Methylobacterium sp. NEAU K]
MMLFAGLLACLTLWWLSKNRDGLGRRLGRAFGRGLGATIGAVRPPKLGGAFALAAAGFLLLHGNVVLAALLGLGGVWMIEGQAAMTARLLRFIKPRFGLGHRRRTALIEILVRPDGSFREGRVIAGPEAGAWLDAMPPGAVVQLLRFCRVRDAEGAALLEAYLDRRAPGWRVDAERDRDPRSGHSAHPGAMTQEEAYEILGLQRGATAEQVRAAHRSLMKITHPDQGGSGEQAARVNAARDRLLNRHR